MKATGIVRKIGEGTVHRKVDIEEPPSANEDGDSSFHAFRL